MALKSLNKYADIGFEPISPRRPAPDPREALSPVQRLLTNPSISKAIDFLSGAPEQPPAPLPVKPAPPPLIPWPGDPMPVETPSMPFMTAPVPEYTQPPPKKPIAEIRSLPKDRKIRPKTPEEIQQDFDFSVSKMADEIFTKSTGLTPEEGIAGKEKLRNVMSRAPLAGMAVVSPLIALGFESLNQAKSVIVSKIKDEKYSPLEIRMLSELIPDDVSNIVKIGSTVAENLADIALMGASTNLAKRGLLKDTLNVIGRKLTKAGYGEGKIDINLDALKQAAKGTTLEAEASRWIKAKTATVIPKGKIGRVQPPPTKGVPQPIIKPPVVETGVPIVKEPLRPVVKMPPAIKKPAEWIKPLEKPVEVRTPTQLEAERLMKKKPDVSRETLPKKVAPPTRLPKPTIFEQERPLKPLKPAAQLEAEKLVKPSFFKKMKEKVAAKTGLFVKRVPETAKLIQDLKPVESPQEMVERIKQLNKFAQSHAILRKAGGKMSRRAAGVFRPKGKEVAKEGEVLLRKQYIKNPADYMSTLSHELGHALEWNMLGDINRNTLKVFGDKLTKEESRGIHDELIAVSKKLVGESEYNSERQYYGMKTELLARFLEKMFVAPGDMMELAPNAMKSFEQQSIQHPIIKEYIEAILSNIDKGAPKVVLLRDIRETYQKHLGKRVGDIAYDEEKVHSVMQERGKFVIGKLIDKKFKNVKDDPAALFKAAESIKVTKGDVPEFGTRDFVVAKTEEEAKTLDATGWEQIGEAIIDGVKYPKFAKQRYSFSEAKTVFDNLSPEGQRLIKDFTAEREAAKDYFNREVIKDVHKIEGNIEGWVHHYFEDKPKVFGKKLKFREKVAGVRKKREGVEGYVEDFKKSMHKVLIDLEGEKVFNDFITRQMARVTKPIVEGENPDPGWVEVVGKLKKGVGLPQEKKMIVIKGGKTFIPKQIRYQMPKEIYERYKLWNGLVDEASTAVRIVNDLNRYWRINILTHPGSAATNFISGGIQYSSKILTDFYKETLTGDIKYEKTRQNLSAMLKVLLPKGWMDAPDWVYGGDLSNYYGQFTSQQGIVDQSIQSYGDKALKLYGAVERYWKKTISTAENVSDLKSLGEVTTEGLRLPTKEERDMLVELNKEVDIYAYDYDNVPVWLQAHQRSTLGQLIKPFAKYPYKYAKHVLRMTGEIFDKTVPLHDRLAKLLSLSTIVALYANYSRNRKEKQETPEATVDIPARMSTRGRLYMRKDDEGKEIFTRVAKYPFINLTEAGMQFTQGNWETGKDIVSDMLGSLGPVGDTGLLALDYRNKYDQYTPVPIILGDNMATFILGYRILNDVSRAMDPFKRRQKEWYQPFTKIIPTTNADLQKKLHGDIRTVKVPVEGKIKHPPGYKGTRTTVDRVLENYSEDILLSLFTGIYQTRIDPEEVKAMIIRKEKDIKAREKKTRETTIGEEGRISKKLWLKTQSYNKKIEGDQKYIKGAGGKWREVFIRQGKKGGRREPGYADLGFEPITK